MASLSGNKIKDTYQSLIKLTDNGNLTTGAKQLTDGFGNNSPLYISTTQIGIGVTPEATYDLHVYQNAKVGGNLTITGDLTVNGTTTTVDTDTLRVEDPLIEVARNNTSSDAVDIGIYGKYAPSGTTLYAGLFRDTGDDKFKLFKSLEEQPTTTVNTSGTGYAVATLVANFEGTLTGVIASTTTATTQSANDNSTKVATTAYVDNQVTLQDLDFAGDSGTGAVDLDSQTFTIAGTSNEIETSASGQTLTIGLPDDVTVTGNLTVNGTGISLSNATNPTITVTDSTNGHYLTMQGLDGASKIDYLSTLIFEYGASNTEAARLTSAGLSITEELTVSGTGQSSFAGQVTVPATPSASTDAASKGYVDSKFQETDTLAEVLALGNTTGGTDIAVSSGDDITFADSSQAIFGAGSDLKIFSDGSGGYIRGVTAIQSQDGTDDFLSTAANAGVSLFYNNSKKFETTNTGINVTGGITGDDSVFIEGNTNPNFTAHDITNETYTSLWSGDTEAALTFNHSLFRITNAAYNFTGTDLVTITSGGLVGIGTSSPSSYNSNANKLVIAGSGNTGLTIAAGTSDDNNIFFSDGTSGDAAYRGIFRYSHSDDAFKFYTAGANERMIIDSSGKVGILKSSPEEMLDVTGSVLISNNEFYKVESASGANYKIAGLTNGNVIQIGAIDYTSAGTIFAGGDNISITTGGASGSTRIKIDSSGNVGIGLTSPSYELDVSGEINATTRYRKNGYEIVGQNSTELRLANASYWQTLALYTNGTPRLTIDSSGKVGIGTSSPSAKLHVETTASSIARFSYNSSNYQDLTYEGSNIVGGSHVFKVGGTERMRIDSGGDVLLGNTVVNPASGFASQRGFGYDNSTGNLQVASTSGTAMTIGRNESSDGQILQLRKESNIKHSFGSTSSYLLGDVGVGATSPVSKLEVQSSLNSTNFTGITVTNTEGGGSNLSRAGIAFKGYDWVQSAIWHGRNMTDGNQGALVLGTNPDTSDLTVGGVVGRMYIINNGNVGIGTAAPADKLTISGGSINIQIPTGSLKFNEGSTNAFAIESNGANGYFKIRDTYNSADRLYINNTGNVGIGTTAPNYKLDVDSTAAGDWITRIKNQSSTGYGLYVQSSNNAAQYLLGLHNGDGYQFVVNGAGNVGIGNTGVTGFNEKLNVTGYGIITENTDGGNRGMFGFFGGTPLLIGTGDGVDVVFRTDNTERMRINSSGNVGIGTTNPQNKFVVKESSNVDMEFGSEADGCFIQTYNRTTSSWGYLRFIAGGGERMRITRAGGEVLINQTSDLTGQIFQVNGYIDQTDTVSAFRLFNGSTFVGGIGSGQWAFSSSSYATDYALYAQNNLLFHAGTGNSIDMMINGSHNVGIGRTTDIAKKLDVLGTGLRLQDDSSYSSITIGASGWTQDYPYQRLDTFNSDGTGYFWALGHRKTDGTKTVRMLISDTSSKYVTVIDQLNVATFASNELGGSGNYPSFTTNIVLRNSGNSYINGGNLGIGTTSPSVPLQVHGQQKWYTTNSDGNELRGFFNPGGSGDDAELSIYKDDGATEGVVWRGTGNSYIRIDSTSLKFINFYYGPSNVGQIVTGGSNVLYQSNSDYRLKENVVEMTGALDRVSQLKPSTYNFISHPEEQVDGFMAHELQEVVPQAVSGEKDEMNEDGTPKYQGVDHSQIVPLLVGAIKELKAEIETLKTQINK